MPELVEPGAAIFGYTSRFSFVPGERVPVHVSCEQVGHYTAELVRLRHGYEGPAGPGFREQRVERVPPSEHDGAFQAPNVGSYVTIADPDGRMARLTSFALALQFLATTPSKPGVQCLAGAWDDAARAGVAVVLVDGRVALRLGDGSGDPELLACSPGSRPVRGTAWTPPTTTPRARRASHSHRQRRR